MFNRLRDRDPGGTLLERTEAGWPDISTLPPDLSKWKAYDKAQRTMQILARDHDAALGGNGGGPEPIPPPVPDTELSVVQNVLILADDPWPALDAPLHYKFWVTADLGLRDIYADNVFIQEAKDQGREVWSWCDCKTPHGYVEGVGTGPDVAIKMALDFDLDGAAGEGERADAFQNGYDAGLRVFVVDLSALTDDQVGLIAAAKALATVELYLNKQPWMVPDWKNANAGIGSNCGATYGSPNEGATATPITTYAAMPAAGYKSMSWYCGGSPKPDFANLP